MSGWKKPEEMRVLGKPQPRLDGPIKVTGRARYAYDIDLPGLLQGRILRCPHAHAIVESVDAGAAEKMPGVKAVVLTAGPGTELHYAGDELGGVAAETAEIAEDAIRAIRVRYKPLPHAVDEAVAMKADAPSVRGGREPNIARADLHEQGDVDSAFREAKAVVEATYHMPVRTHCSLEPHGVTCRWDDDTHLTCWASTQGVFSVRDDLAQTFNLSPANVLVITEVMGGGFGSKFGAGYEGVMCARLAKEARAPVKLLLTRWEEQTSVGNAPSVTARVRIGADAQGSITAFEARVHGTGGLGDAGIPCPYVYRAAAHRVEQRSVYINAGSARAWRAPGHPQGSFVMECAVEDLAIKLGMDPLEFRLKNDPNTMRQAQWKEAARRIGWSRRNPKPGIGALAGTGRYRRGLGCGASEWGGGGRGPYKARVTIHNDGSVVVETGVQDIGTGTRTYCAMIAAEELGIPVSLVTADIGHSNYGFAAASGGSTTTASTAPPVKRAAEAARQALLEAVAPKLGAKPEELETQDGKVFVKADPAHLLSWKQACTALGMGGAVGDGTFDPALQQSGVAGCQFVEVEVDTETGRVQPIKVVAVQDGGIILNPLTYTSQMNGGVIQGIGLALYEDRIMSQNTGRPVNADMENYKLVGPMEMPEFDPVPFENPGAHGVTGIGEPPVIPTAGAIRNAILNATGAYLYAAPMTPARVLSGIHAAAARRSGTQRGKA